MEKLPNPDPGAAAGAKLQRYKLRQVAQSVLIERDTDRRDQHRTCLCHRIVTGAGGFAKLRRAIDGSGARVTGITVCGAVHTCPVCAGAIAEHHRKDLSDGLARHQAAGGAVYMLTRTFPHSLDMPLADLLTRQARAEQSFRNSKTVKSICDRAGRVGSCTALETTIGGNGWHPHRHELLFAAPGLMQHPAVLREFKRQWLRQCLKAGLIDWHAAGLKTKAQRAERLRTFIREHGLKPFRNFWRHGLQIQDGSYAAEYIAKYGREPMRWNLAREMTQAHRKIGLRRAAWMDDLHFTPFELLVWYGKGDMQAAALFREYAAAFAGKRALTWSRGLRGLLLGPERADDPDDAALADRPMAEEEAVGTLAVEDIALIHSRGAFGELIARTMLRDIFDSDTLAGFLYELRGRARTHRGTTIEKTGESFQHRRGIEHEPGASRPVFERQS